MERIIVASTNPVKIDSTLRGFHALFPDREFSAAGISVPSNVSHQPMTDDETMRGALNRAANARQQVPDADYWVGIEGGIEECAGEMSCFAWIVILAKDKIGKSRTATFYLPREIIELIHQGVELGEADDRVFGRSNSKQQNGSIGILTDDVVTRTTYYEHAVIMALVPFKNTHLQY